MLNSGARRMWKCMSITGELQCGVSCAFNGDAKATTPNEVNTARLSIVRLPIFATTLTHCFGPWAAWLCIRLLQCKDAFADAAKFQLNPAVHFGIWIGHKKLQG